MKFRTPNASYPFSVVDTDRAVGDHQVEVIFLGPADGDLMQILVCLRDPDGQLIEESPVYNNFYAIGRWLQVHGISRERAGSVIVTCLKEMRTERHF